MLKSVIHICLILSTCFVVNAANAYVVEKEDPLRPPEYRLVKPSNDHGVKKQKQGWHVNEILFSGERRVAIVNNVAVVIGDKINGARIVDIKPAYVVLKYKDKTINARLTTVSVKKKVKQK